MNLMKETYINDVLAKEGYSGSITGFTECIGCAGVCCKKNACSCSVREFEKISVRSIEELLDTGKYMITASYEYKNGWRGIPIEAIPHISAREVGVPEKGILISMMHSACAMLGPKGCIFSKEERPCQGLLLIPDKEECRCLMDIPSEEWKPYKSILNKVIKKRTGFTAQELFEKELPILAVNLKRRIQLSMFTGEAVTYAEYAAAEAMDSLGVFYGLFGEKLGDAMHYFIDQVPVKGP